MNRDPLVRMNQWPALLLVIGLVSSFAAVPVAAAREGENLNTIIKKWAPITVNVVGYIRKVDDHQKFGIHSSSSGLLIDKRGYVLTVYQQYTRRMGRRLCEKFKVTLYDGKALNATLFAADPLSNIAILKILEPGVYSFITVDTKPKIINGMPVIAIGGIGTDSKNIVAKGVVKTKSRATLYQSGLASLLIDTHMELPEEAYGGALLDTSGLFIGMSVPAMHDNLDPNIVENEGHALPVDVIKMNYKMLMARPTFEQPWMGMAVRPLSLEEAAEFYEMVNHIDGLFIEFVWPGSPADKLGLRASDILLKVNDSKLRTKLDYDRLLFNSTVGDEVAVSVYRKNTEKFDRKIRLIKRPLWAAP